MLSVAEKERRPRPSRRAVILFYIKLMYYIKMDAAGKRGREIFRQIIDIVDFANDVLRRPIGQGR
jgi:hypothetical protein